MRVKRQFTTCLVGLSLFGLLLPTGALTHATEPTRLQQSTVKDLALDNSGTLRGQVVNSDAVGRAGAIVTLQRSSEGKVRATADRQGVFAISGLSSGVYTISSGEALAVARVWQVDTAPPAAADGILLVHDGAALRGKGKGGAGLGNVGLGVLLAAGAIGTIIAVVVAQNDAS